MMENGPYDWMVLAVWLVSRLFPQVTSITSPPARHIRQETDTSSEEILRRRYAAGEITKDEYEDMREELRK